ncbi:MAG: diversity-generating retroelement protein Avd [Thiomicrospira sp.]|nr:MAG: diversity-generating retroelement protein Avd [Thiomicrospira sp.]
MNALAIVEKYDVFMDFIYPKIQGMPKRHGQFRDKFLSVLLRIPGELYLASKVRQVSKLHILDASLGELRWLLRFAVSNKTRLITHAQHTAAMVMLSEVGSMLNAWIKKIRH